MVKNTPIRSIQMGFRAYFFNDGEIFDTYTELKSAFNIA